MRAVRSCGHADVDVGLGELVADLSAGVAGQGDHRHVLGARRGDGGEDVRGVAARRHRQQDVAGRAERLDLLGEDHLVAVVVADGGEDRGVDGQRDRRQAGPLALEAADELRGEMLGVGGRAAVAAGEHLAAAGDAADQRADRVGDRLGEDFGRRVLEVGAVEELLLNALLEHGRG